MTEQPLTVVADSLDRLIQSTDTVIDAGQGLTPDLTTDLRAALEAISKYARMASRESLLRLVKSEPEKQGYVVGLIGGSDFGRRAYTGAEREAWLRGYSSGRRERSKAEAT